jgi:membrane-associated protease RseP (regulator of RpoE activity)
MKRLTAVLTAVVVVSAANLSLGQRVEGIGNTLLTFTSETPSLGQDWLGLRVTTLPDDLRQKLDLPKEQGLVVREVVPDSPGAKASIKPDDVLVKAGDRPLKNYADILEAIRDAKKSGLALEFLRDGKTFEVVLKPVNRPSGFELPEGLQRDGAISKNPLAGQELHRAQLQRIRAELQGVQQRIAAINRELAELDQLSQTNPDRERLLRQMTAMKRAAAALTEVGRSEDAERLQREMRELSEKLKAVGGSGAGGPAGGAMIAPVPVLPGASPDSATQRAVVFLKNFSDGTEPPAAFPLQFKPGDSPAHPRQPDPAVADLRKQVEEMHRELNELRELIAKKKGE